MNSVSLPLLLPSHILSLRFFPRLRHCPFKSSSFYPRSNMNPQPENPEDSSSNRRTHVPDEAQTPIYPVPLSPPLPPISKDIELRRAMSASSRSRLFSLSRNDVVFEDEWLLVVNKPQGIYCESVLSSVPYFLNDSPYSHSNGDPSGSREFHLANRLDRDTSGVLIITKSHKVAGKLVQAFTDHKVRKTYIALCIGLAPTWGRIQLKSGHGRSKHGVWRVYAASDVGCVLPNGSTVKEMETLFQVLRINVQDSGCEVSGYVEDGEETIVAEEKSAVTVDGMKDEILVRAFPRSGRTHQIRLHCQYLGMPIRGDVKYHGVPEWKGVVFEGHALHAESLSFEHPVTHLPVLIQAPLPSWAREELSTGKESVGVEKEKKCEWEDGWEIGTSNS